MSSPESFEDIHLCVSAAGFETDQDFYGILFIGSSYFKYNNLPIIFKNIADSLGKQVFIDQQIISGLLIKWTYWMNCNNNKSSVYTSDFVVYVEFNEKIK